VHSCTHGTFHRQVARGGLCAESRVKASWGCVEVGGGGHWGGVFRHPWCVPPPSLATMCYTFLSTSAKPGQFDGPRCVMYTGACVSRVRSARRPSGPPVFSQEPFSVIPNQTLRFVGEARLSEGIRVTLPPGSRMYVL